MLRPNHIAKSALALGAILAASASGALDVTGSSAGVSWAAATGPVAGYAVQVSRNGGSYVEVARVTGTQTRVSGQVGDRVLVRVAAYDSTGRMGSPSVPSDPVNFVSTAPPPPPPAPPPPPGGGGGNSTGDLDGDGTADALAYNAKTGELSVLLIKANGTRAWQVLASPSDPGLRPAGYADVDGDGQADVLWRNPVTGANEIWRMNGTSHSLVSLPSQAASYRVASFRDFSGDGLADLLFHAVSTGDSVLWTLNGSGQSAVLPVDPAPAGASLAAVADLDGDAFPDLVWHATVANTLEAWRMNGADPMAVFSLPSPRAGARLVGAADVDGDGDDDLAWWMKQGKKRRRIDVWLVDGMNAPAQGIAAIVSRKAKWRGLVDVNDDGRSDLLFVRKSGFSATSVSSTGSANAAGDFQWNAQFITLDEVPASKRWYFLVLE
jgi:hypothetical protein